VTVGITLELGDDQLDELLEGGRPAGVPGLPAGLEDTTAGLPHAPCELILERGARRGHGWVGAEHAAVVVPAGRPAARRLHVVPTDFVPDALARLNDLGPRPGGRLASPIRFAPGVLAQLVATNSAELQARVREHWRVDALWQRPDGEVAGRSVEVLDTNEGLWLVAPVADGEVELTHVRPAEVFRLLCDLLPSAAELAGEHAG
jgi:hypothetical protein